MQVELLASNAKQLSQIARETFSNYDAVIQTENCSCLSTGDELACLWNRANGAHTAWKSGELPEQEVIERYFKVFSEILTIRASLSNGSLVCRRVSERSFDNGKQL